MEDMTPRQIVEELDKYIIGQDKAKRAVAIALRNRYRRRMLPDEMREEIIPKNILMIGPTGVGKTEIARRLATLANAPFVKVEATKFTEVGYVGRDVDSMVRDLVQIAVRMLQNERVAEVRPKAENQAIERVLDLLAPRPLKERLSSPFESAMRNLGGFFGKEPEAEQTPEEEQNTQEEEARAERLRDKLRVQLEAGALDDRRVEVEVEEANTSFMPVFTQGGMEEMGVNLQDMLGGMLPKRRKTRNVSIAEAKKILTDEEAAKMIDMDEVVRNAIERAEQSGIIFVDELDKIAGKSAQGSGPDVSREGVQRDILPIIEGSTVVTKYGPVRTNHILFIAAGAFHVNKPSDLIPELQGRLPIRVELDNLNESDFKKILTEPRNALIKQYTELLSTEGVQLEFSEESIDEIARVAAQVNSQTENIGARRLHTVMEHLLEELSFTASEHSGETITIDADYVRTRLATIAGSEDLSRYIL